MATILVPGFLRWDGTKYILDPDVEGSTGPTILNSSVGVLPDVVSDLNGVPAEIITFTGTSAITLTGVKDGVESRQLKVFNTSSSGSLTIKHLSNVSLSANQIICPGSVDYVLNFRESVMLIYSINESKWRVTDKEAEASGGTTNPGGTNGQLQFNNANTFGGITNWSTTGANRIHINYKLMTDGPALEFNGNQITRLFGSWISDGFQVGDLFSIRGLWYDNSNVPQTPLNIVNTTVTAVTDDILTMVATITPAGYALAGETFAQGGGLVSGGDSIALMPDSGMFRIPQPDSFIDTEVMTFRRSNGSTCPVISVSESEIMIGGTFNESNTAAGVTNRRPSNLAFWGGFEIDFCDERVWRDDKGFFTNYLVEFRANVSTSNATPTQLLNKSVSSLNGVGPFIELYVTANKSSFPPASASWRFFGSKSSTTFDWRTASYYQATSGAATWACSVTGDATITVTGQASTSIFWKVYGRFI